VPHPNDKSDRKHVCHDPAPLPKDPRLQFGKSVSDNDVQARSECVQRLEKNPWSHSPQRPSPRSSFHRQIKRANTQRKETATLLRKQSIQRNCRLNQQIANKTFDSNAAETMPTRHFRSLLAQFRLTPKSKRVLAASEPAARRVLVADQRTEEKGVVAPERSLRRISQIRHQATRIEFIGSW
jgi:hypothetical protein